jgi:voltage-gated potassium channel
MHIWAQLLWAGVLTVLCLLVHGFGIVAITRLLRLEEQRLRKKNLGMGAFLLLTGLALCVFLLHAAEIAIFAAFYVAADVLPGFDDALYFSAASYSTLGTTDLALPDGWRLVGAIEGVAGFLLLGWSTAFFVTDMNILLRDKRAGP